MTRKEQWSAQVILHTKNYSVRCCGCQGDAAGHNLCGLPVHEVCAEAEDGALVDAEEDPTLSEGSKRTTRFTISDKDREIKLQRWGVWIFPTDTCHHSRRGRRQDCSSWTTLELLTPITPTRSMIEDRLQATSIFGRVVR